MSNITEYLDFSKSHPKKFIENEFIPICLNEKDLREYENKTKIKLGIIFENPWFIVINDLIRKKDGTFYPYLRLLCKNEYTGSVIIPCYKDKIILLRQFRHGIQDFSLEFPRGAFEKEISPKENAIKEIKEEIGQSVLNTQFLGTTIADTSFGTGEVFLYKCIIPEIPNQLQQEEGIDSISVVTKDELLNLIASNTIKDSFTLAATIKALSQGLLD